MVCIIMYVVSTYALSVYHYVRSKYILFFKVYIYTVYIIIQIYNNDIIIIIIIN